MSFRALAAACVFMASGTSQASLVSNGSFESLLTDWTCSVSSSGNCATAVLSPTPIDGSAFFLGYENGSTPRTLSLTLSTVAGLSYSISLYFLTSAQNSGNTLSLSVGNLSTALNLVPASSNSLYGPWVNYSGAFTASGPSTPLSFSFTTLNQNGSVYLDNIVVQPVPVSVPVPEPTALALAALGLLGLGAARRRAVR